MRACCIPNPSLGRGEVPSSILPTPMSAAALQATRLAVQDQNNVYVASGKSVYRLECTMETPQRNSSGHDGVANCDADYCTPSNYIAVTASAMIPHSAHRSEVMSVSSDGFRLASIDSFGACIITQSPEADAHAPAVLPPASSSCGEPGWAGVAFHSKHSASVVTARQYFRDVSLFDRDILIRTIHTLSEPAGVVHIGDSGNLAVLEGNSVALYDVRVNGNATCTARKMPSHSCLMSLDAMEDGSMVAVAGKDRTLHVLDTRTMTFRDRWSSCLKYECSGVKFSPQMHGFAYVSGVDNEVACGTWCSRTAERVGGGMASHMMSGANAKSSRRCFGFRGDTRLAGFDVIGMESRERGFAISEAGGLYIMDVATQG